MKQTVVMVCGIVMFSVTYASTDYRDICNVMGERAKTLYQAHQKGESKESYYDPDEVEQHFQELAELSSTKVSNALRLLFDSIQDDAFSQPKESSVSMRIKKANEFQQQKIAQCKTQYLPVLEQHVQEVEQKAMQQARERYAKLSGVNHMNRSSHSMNPFNKSQFTDNYHVVCNDGSTGGIVVVGDYNQSNTSTLYKWTNFDSHLLGKNGYGNWQTDYGISVDEAARRICP